VPVALILLAAFMMLPLSQSFAEEYTLYSRSRTPDSMPVSQEAHATIVLTCERTQEGITFSVRDADLNLWTTVNKEDAKKLLQSEGVAGDTFFEARNTPKLIDAKARYRIQAGTPVPAVKQADKPELQEVAKLIDFVFFPHVAAIREKAQYQGLALRASERVRLSLDGGRTLDVYLPKRKRPSSSTYMFRLWRADESRPLLVRACTVITVQGADAMTELDVVSEGSRAVDLLKEAYAAISSHEGMKDTEFRQLKWREPEHGGEDAQPVAPADTNTPSR